MKSSYFFAYNACKRGEHMRLYQLFYECVNIPYLAAGCCANYAVRRECGTLYIFLEKSVGAVDWKSNFDFPAAAYKRAGKTAWFAHRGFLAVWKEIEPMLAAAILDESVTKIVIVGYSQGAAVAVLCHEYVWFNRPDLRETLEGYGFGCPRVFWGIRRAELMRRWEKFTVVRNIDDIVTHVPPFLLGYSHVGKMLKIGRRGKYSAVDAHRDENILRELEEMEWQ